MTLQQQLEALLLVLSIKGLVETEEIEIAHRLLMAKAHRNAWSDEGGEK